MKPSPARHKAARGIKVMNITKTIKLTGIRLANLHYKKEGAEKRATYTLKSGADEHGTFWDLVEIHATLKNGETAIYWQGLASKKIDGEFEYTAEKRMFRIDDDRMNLERVKAVKL